ncbi:unnamed protein product [Amoebophrya sp. A120]|nr:unnamed protein product [Amoebophrya sp. A120]|eukprot:GSA120T00023938001.1
MTIDINLLRENKGGDPEKVRESERRRFRDPKTVDEVIALDKAWVAKQYDMEQKKKEMNAVQKKIGEKKKASGGKDKCEEEMAEKGKLEEAVKQLEQEAGELHKKRDETLAKIGNILDDSVPVSQDEDKDNEVVALWGKIPTFDAKYQTDGFRPHFELIEMIGGINFEAGRDVFGSRGYFLTGPAVLLNQALINYGLAFLMREGYTPVQPPFMMKKDVMAQAAELKDYDDVLYKVTEGEEHPELDRYLIATSEQPITALYRNKVIDMKELRPPANTAATHGGHGEGTVDLNPDSSKYGIRFAGVSSCFRKEAGSSGRDIRGIFRCHQFEKVEQFCIVDEDKSKEEHVKISKVAERFYQSLGFPYRVVNIVSGEINDAASKKFDLEAWFPGDADGKGQYRELVSASNCLDFQSRRMDTRAGHGTDQQFPHMLNSTLVATQRCMCCLLENYQTKEGIDTDRLLIISKKMLVMVVMHSLRDFFDLSCKIAYNALLCQHAKTKT